MPIPVVCPSCQHKFAVPDSYAGKRGKCPSCASVFRAPTAEAVLAAAKAQGPSEAPPLPDEDIPVGTAVEIPVGDIPVGRAVEIPVDDIPVGRAIEEPPIAGEELDVAPPAAPFILESPVHAAGKVLSSVKRPASHSASGPNPLVLAGIAGGVVLVVGVIAVAVWAAAGGSSSKPVAGAGKQAKKSAATETDPEDEQPTKPKTDTSGNAPTKSNDKPVEPGKTPGKTTDLGPLPEFEKPEAPIPPPVFTPPPPPSPPADALTVESIQKLAEECRAMNWRPADAEQFTKVQILARLVAQAKSAEENPANPVEERTNLGAAAQEVLKTLSETPWAPDAQIADLNRLSAATLKSEELGVFAFGTVMGMTNGAPRLLLLELGGTMEVLAIPVKTTELETPAGSRWLVLGRRVPGQIVQIDIKGGGMDRTFKPPLVNVTHLIGEPGN